MLNPAGPELDRQIERKLNGDTKKKTPPYSTSEKAANRLVRRLELQDMPCSIEEIDGVWYCTFWIVFPESRERLSTGSGETRALAIARAVMNARLGMGASLARGATGTVTPRHWTHGGSASDGPAASCAGCGVALASRNREAVNRFCPVCSWRAGKHLLGHSSAIGVSRERSVGRAISIETGSAPEGEREKIARR